MWNIHHVEHAGKASLYCGHPADNAENNFSLEITSYENNDVQIMLHSSSEQLLEKYKTRLNFVQSIVPTAISLIIKLNINREFALFNSIIDIFDTHMQSFHAVRDKLSLIIKANKKDILDLNSARIIQENTNLEAQAENNMRPAVFASARSSELALRDKYNFPAPSYISKVYSEQENAAIRNFRSYLLFEINKLINNSMVYKRINDDFHITKRAQKILKNHANNSQTTEYDLAYYALNLTATYRAVTYRGSHNTNNGMKHTKIIGYGMRNLVALLWHCIVVARNTKPSGYMPGINFEDAFKAIVTGIANGARGGNRNNDSGVDNLDFYDTQVCDQGRYNVLIEAFNGVFKEVNIIYNFTELLTQELQNEIIQHLLAFNKKLSTSLLYLNLWLGVDTNPPSERYIRFVERVKDDLPNMIERFLHKVCNHDPELKNRIRTTIMQDIAATESSSIGIPYIELISPRRADLLKSWEQKQSAIQAKSEAEVSKANKTRKRPRSIVF